DAGVKPVLEARDVTSGYRLFRRNRPNLIIVDLGMQGSVLAGLDLIRRMRSHEPCTCILVFTMHNDPMIAARALEAGATGYLLKDTSSDELMKAFDQVRSGKPYLSEDLAMRVAFLRTRVGLNPLVAHASHRCSRCWRKAKLIAASPRSSASATRPWSMPASTLSGSLAPKI